MLLGLVLFSLIKKYPKNLVKKRSLSIIDAVVDRLKGISQQKNYSEGKVFNLNFQEALDNINLDNKCIIYAKT